MFGALYHAGWARLLAILDPGHDAVRLLLHPYDPAPLRQTGARSLGSFGEHHFEFGPECDFLLENDAHAAPARIEGPSLEGEPAFRLEGHPRGHLVTGIA